MVPIGAPPAPTIDSPPDPIQTLTLPTRRDDWEGIAYSCAGDILALAALNANTVFLYRRGADGSFESQPYSRIGGPESGLRYPHDVAFAPAPDGELLAVAHRIRAIAIYRKYADGTFGPKPAFVIRGEKTKLRFSDGVAFVPPSYNHLAVCNLKTETISFYRLRSASPICFGLEPVFELRHRSLGKPDGLAFSGCGRWLAIANHGIHTVSIFARCRGMLFRGTSPRYGPDPVTVIEDATLRYPHSVAFTPGSNHLVVTNAGANYFSIYAPRGRGRYLRWSQVPLGQTVIGPDALFRQVNAGNEMEGGPKGVAVYRDSVAICSPIHGAKIYSLPESVIRAA